jgi:hypothetical protein
MVSRYDDVRCRHILLISVIPQFLITLFSRVMVLNRFLQRLTSVNRNKDCTNACYHVFLDPSVIMVSLILIRYFEIRHPEHVKRHNDSTKDDYIKVY